MITEFELGWLVGYIEGEGCFNLHVNSSLRISIQSMDYDVMLKCASILGRIIGKEVRVGWTDRSDQSGIFQFAVYGKNAEKVMALLVNHMGERRQAKIREILERKYEYKAA